MQFNGKKIIEITKKLKNDCNKHKREIIQQNSNVDFAYNPLEYAWEPHKCYLEKYSHLGAKTIIMGMNPGHGMGNTGIPFGCPEKVKNYLKITNLKVGKPTITHPKRKISGLKCKKPEVSGKRIWGLIEEIYGPAENAFSEIFIINHFPLWMFNNNGQNITPDKLKVSSTSELFEICNKYIVDMAQLMNVKHIIGVGKYAHKMAMNAVNSHKHKKITISEIPHPSPANPLANREKGAIWKKMAEKIITT